jgi:hypothetical protein
VVSPIRPFAAVELLPAVIQGADQSLILRGAIEIHPRIGQVGISFGSFFLLYLFMMSGAFGLCFTFSFFVFRFSSRFLTRQARLQSHCLRIRQIDTRDGSRGPIASHAAGGRVGAEGEGVWLPPRSVR